MPRSFPLLLILAAAAGCSQSSDPPPAPPSQPGNTPAIPTVANPGDQLPATSDQMTIDTALLSSFSPEIDAAPFVDEVNRNTLRALPFQERLLQLRLPPGRSFLVQDGEACYPTGLLYQLRDTGPWQPAVQTVSQPCFEHLLDYGGSHYYVSREPASWEVADLNCRLAGWDMVSITSQAENDAVFASLLFNGTPTAFIGLTDWGRPNGTWIWRSGEPVHWTNWYPGEPNNASGEYFAYFHDREGRWNDIDQYRMYYVLETTAEFEEMPAQAVPALLVDNCPLQVRGYGMVAEMPVLERRLYWRKVFQTTIGSGATYSEQHRYSHGTSETTGLAFGWSLGISASIGWGPCSTEIEAQFYQDFNREITVSEESTITKTYELTAPVGQTVVFALWQLRERYVITDALGRPWEDAQYELAGSLPDLDQGLAEEYVQTLYFESSG